MIRKVFTQFLLALALGGAALAQPGPPPILSVGTTNVVNGSINQCLTIGANNKLASTACAAVPVTTFSAGTTGLTPSSPTTGAIVLSGTLLGINGGTGVANSGKTITLGGNFVTSGAFATTLTATAGTNVTLPTTGTLATLAGTETLSNKTLTGTVTVNGIGFPSSGGTGAVISTVYRQAITSTGTYTPHAGMQYVDFECWGAGGGGGGSANAGAGTGWSGGGGGAGGYSKVRLTAAQIGASKAVAIGTAGTAGTAGNNAGGAGGDTTVGTTLCVGKGGTGGAGATGGAVSVTGGGLGGAGGVAGTGDETGTGAPGFTGCSSANSPPCGGAGGSSSVGGGGISPNAQNNGGAGSGKASGGAGGISVNAAGLAAGGAGTAGYIVFTEYANQ